MKQKPLAPYVLGIHRATNLLPCHGYHDETGHKAGGKFRVDIVRDFGVVQPSVTGAASVKKGPVREWHSL